MVSSAGPIAWACGGALAAQAGRSLDIEGWLPLHRVLVNASVSQLAVGRSGVTLLSLNEHQHLRREQVTTR